MNCAPEFASEVLAMQSTCAGTRRQQPSVPLKLQMPNLLTLVYHVLQLFHSGQTQLSLQAQLEPTATCLLPGSFTVDEVLIPAGEAAPPSSQMWGGVPPGPQQEAQEAGPLPLSKMSPSGEGASTHDPSASGLTMFGSLRPEDIWASAGSLPPVRTRRQAHEDGTSTLTPTAPQ